MKKKTTLILLVCITALAAVLRIYAFPGVPMGLNRDEMALGYNAFSLLKTGQDEWGMQWPVVFRSFGDYKLGGYIYTLIPFIWMFGLGELAVRLPSLLAGVLLPLAIFYFLRTVTKDVKLGLFGAFVVAVMPWAIFYSRVGFEANLALAIFVVGMAFMFKSLDSWKYGAASVGCFFISLLTYNAPLILLPAVAAVFVLLYRRRAVKSATAVLFAVAAALLILLPAIRGKGTITVFSDPGILLESQALYLRAGNNVAMRMFANPVVYTSIQISKRYFMTFSPTFLIMKGGGNPWHQTDGSGHLTWAISAMAVIGVVEVLRKRKKEQLFLLGVLAVSPIPSAITVDAPHATRSLLFLLMIGVFAAFGMRMLWRKHLVLGWLAGAIVLINSATYFQHYLRVMGSPAQAQWNSGVGEAIRAAEALHVETGFPIVYLGDPHYSYIATLFYTKFDPPQYRNTVEYYIDDVIGLSQVKKYGHYLFVSDVKDGPSPAIVIEQDQADGGFSVHENR